MGLARVLYGTLHQYTGILWKQSLPRVWDVHGRYNSSPSKLQCHAAMPIFSLLLCCDCVPFCSAFPCEPAAGRRLRTTVHLCQKQRLPGLTVSLSFDQERPPQRKQPKEKLPKSKKCNDSIGPDKNIDLRTSLSLSGLEGGWISTYQS